MYLLQAVVFDFDGTIIDSESSDYRSWQELYARFGVDLPWERWAKGIGGAAGAVDLMSHLEKELGRPIDRQRWGRWRRERDITLSRSRPMLPGVESLIKEALAAGVKIGLATSGGRRWAESHLRRLTIYHHFEIVCTADDVGPHRVKPHPALYTMAVEGLGVEPGRAVAVEDSPNGAKAALAAGMHCIVVPNPATKALTFPEGAVPFNSLDEVTLAILEELVSRPLTGF